ncbi:Gfo/Idh/MocA family oxidoreductase [bacterium]|nr:Gfo/Idh/MocA family oxidoreductase [bacterium]
MSKTYRVAFIGCGRRAKQHVPGVKADARCNVVALADVKREAAETMNTEAGFGAAVYTDHRAMLEKERPDVIITCLWTPLHLPVFKDCVAAGVKAVLSEKPMAPTWGECLEMGRIADEKKCLLTFCHQRRFAKGNQLVRKLIAEGRFGAIQRMDLYSPKNLLDCGTHTFDQALSFNGESPAKWVLGAVDTSQLIKWFDVSAEVMATGLVVFQNGVRAYFQVGDLDKDMGTGVRVHGSEGFVEVEWDGQIRRAVVYNEPQWAPPVIEDTPENHMVGVVRNAIDCLETGAEPELSHRKALRAAEIIFALYESVRRRARVELPITSRDNAFLTLLESGALRGQAPNRQYSAGAAERR